MENTVGLGSATSNSLPCAKKEVQNRNGEECLSTWISRCVSLLNAFKGSRVATWNIKRSNLHLFVLIKTTEQNKVRG